MTIYNISGIVKTSFDIAVTPRNIVSGFRTTGIWPVNTEIFQDDYFLPSQMTARALVTPKICTNSSNPDLSSSTLLENTKNDERTPRPVNTNNISSDERSPTLANR